MRGKSALANVTELAHGALICARAMSIGFVMYAFREMRFGLKSIACLLGYHGSSLTRVSSNTFHIDYRCSYCDKEKTVFRR